ncbi:MULTISPECIES: hypothetical protein [Citrobacter]|uniref:hypothetical protein n=1 Tax=Citrobacter TaxID=544 RepID=UPI0019028CF0|nr:MULTISPECIES: hypothetical protein [Citrobacter]MBJ8400900.1 hypothetical protein [Citrobacter youngae]MBJ9603092.1 hypothetical protein [Citrobacter sp. FDAARGOS_156]
MFKIGEFKKAIRDAGIRTIAAERHEAIHYYEGKPCKVCEETTRYRSNKRCVYCKHEMDAWNYQQRKQGGKEARHD